MDNKNFDIGEHLNEEFSSLISSGKYHEFSKETKDSFLDYLEWSCYGDIIENRIWIILLDKRSNKRYFGWIKSTLEYPLMVDRIFGIDIEDLYISFKLTDMIFEKYKNQLE